MRLGDFILSRIEEILAAWEDFSSTMSVQTKIDPGHILENHPRQMLKAIALDLSHQQSKSEQFQKSIGEGPQMTTDTAAETHGAARLLGGFSVQQLISEYRALRASVLSLWASETKGGLVTDPDDVMRFNEAIDQALAESVARYSKLVDRSQNMFLAVLGHDLRNPLATTMLASHFILQSDLQGPISTAASRIHSAGKRMNGLVNDLIEYTRSNLGITLPIILKETDVSALCADSLGEHAIAHPEIDFQLVAEAGVKSRLDDNRVAQALSNLLSNAVQYGKAGSPIVMRVKEAGDKICISLQNHGPVIPVENFPALFQPLIRFSNPLAEAEVHSRNLGIGLYIAHEIIDAHGGSIEVSSNEMDGTEFVITLPRHPSVQARNMRLG